MLKFNSVKMNLNGNTIKITSSARAVRHKTDRKRQESKSANIAKRRKRKERVFAGIRAHDPANASARASV